MAIYTYDPSPCRFMLVPVPLTTQLLNTFSFVLFLFLRHGSNYCALLSHSHTHFGGEDDTCIIGGGVVVGESNEWPKRPRVSVGVGDNLCVVACEEKIGWWRKTYAGSKKHKSPNHGGGTPLQNLNGWKEGQQTKQRLVWWPHVSVQGILRLMWIKN